MFGADATRPQHGGCGLAALRIWSDGSETAEFLDGPDAAVGSSDVPDADHVERAAGDVGPVGSGCPPGALDRARRHAARTHEDVLAEGVVVRVVTRVED